MVTHYKKRKGYKFEVASDHGRRDATGSILGILVFLGGVGLLLNTFRLANDMFTTPPRDALGTKGAKVLEVGVVGNSLTVILLRIALLLIMGVVGSLIANKGVFLYTHSRGIPVKPEPKD